VCHQTASLAARHLAGNTGGAISNFTGTVTVTSSLVNGNIAQGFGGGIANFGFNMVSLTNVTLSGNRGRLGGGIANLQIGTLHLQNVTITNNTGRFSEDATRGSRRRRVQRRERGPHGAQHADCRKHRTGAGS
jgi:hypothetical protein